MNQPGNHAGSREAPPQRQAESAPQEPQPENARRSGWSSYLLPLLLTALMFSWLLYRPGREISNWYLAAAIDQQQQGNLQRAIELAEKAAAWDPENLEIREQRADWFAQADQLDEAIEELSIVAEAKPLDPKYAVERAEFLQREGRHDEALADMDKYFKLVGRSIQDRLDDEENPPSLDEKRLLANVLNARSYFAARSIAAQDQKLAADDQLIVDSQWTVDVAQESSKRISQIHTLPERYKLEIMLEEANVLDTLGYLQYLSEDYESAYENLSRAVSLSEQIWPQLWRRISDETQFEPGLALERKVLMQHSLAVMLHHRGLALQKLDREDEAQHDLKQAQQLGYDPAKGVW